MSESPELSNHPRPAVTVDCAVFGVAETQDLEVLLVRRDIPPFQGAWALPGSFVAIGGDGDGGESLEDAARRALAQKANVQVDYLEQLYTFGDPRRDPRGRVITVGYYALVRSREHGARAGRDTLEARWVPVTELPRLAFDHGRILETALERLKAKVSYAPIGFALLPERFTLSQLQRLYEAILGRPLDKRNFRKRLSSMRILSEAGETSGGPGRPARLYRFDKVAYDRAVKRGLEFDV